MNTGMIPNISNFYGTNIPQAPVRYAGMVHTATHQALGMNIYQPTYAQQLLERYADQGLILYPMLDAKAKVTLYNQHGFSIKSNWYPSLRVMQDVRAVRSRSTSTILVDNTDGLRPNMMFILAPIGELMMIRSVDSEHQVTVMRGLGSSAPQDIRAGTVLQYSGNVFEEGSYRPLGVVSRHSEWHVHTMILRTGWATSDTAKVALNKQGVNVFAEGKEDAHREHVQAIEAALMFSQHGNTMLNGMPMRTMSGIIDFIRHAAPQNMITVATAVDKDDLDNIFNMAGNVELTNTTTRNRMCLCDGRFAKTVDMIGRLAESPLASGITNETSLYARTKYTKVETNKLSVDVTEHPSITRVSSANGKQLGMGMVIDPTSMDLFYLGGRRIRVSYFNADANGNTTQMEYDNGVDGSGGSYISEIMFVNRNPATSALIYNLVDASAPKIQPCLKVC